MTSLSCSFGKTVAPKAPSFDQHNMDRRRAISAIAGAAAATAVTCIDSAVAQPMPGVTDNARLQRVKAGVLEVAYSETGPLAGPPILLLHGFPYDIRCFDEVAPILSRAGKRVVVPYLRGFGPTRFINAAIPRVGQQAALGNDVVALLDALGIQRAVLAGFDWGARSACVTAALHPDRVAGLVSSGGPGYNIQDETKFLTSRSPEWERSHWFYYYLNSQRGMDQFAMRPADFCRYLWKEFSPKWRFSDAIFQQTAVAFENPDFVAVALHSYRFRIGGVPGDPLLESEERRLAEKPVIRAPTIVLQGADEGVDRPEPLTAITPYFEQLRRATVLAGVGHNAPQEAPDLFARAVIEVAE